MAVGFHRQRKRKVALVAEQIFLEPLNRDDERHDTDRGDQNTVDNRRDDKRQDCDSLRFLEIELCKKPDERGQRKDQAVERQKHTLRRLKFIFGQFA